MWTYTVRFRARSARGGLGTPFAPWSGMVTTKRVETGLGMETSVCEGGREIGRVRKGTDGWYAYQGTRRLNGAPRRTRKQAIECLVAILASEAGSK